MLLFSSRPGYQRFHFRPAASAGRRPATRLVPRKCEEAGIVARAAPDWAMPAACAGGEGAEGVPAGGASTQIV